MYHLIVNPDTRDAWEIPLRPGSNTLGSGDEHEFPIQHPSVASAHCELIVGSAGVQLKDFIVGTETNLLPGQTLQLGEVYLRLEGSAEKPAVSPARIHKPKPFVSLAAPDSNAGKSFATQIAGAFTYPLNEDGLILLIGGTVFFCVLGFAARFSGFLGLAIGILGTGYLIQYLQNILNDSADGRDKMPDWPDLSEMGNLLSPYLQFVVTAAVSFGPAIALGIFATVDIWWLDWRIIVAILFGCLYFPMAFLGVTLFDSIGAVSPHVVLPAICKVPLKYLFVVALLAVVFTLELIGEIQLSRLLRIPILPGLISEFLALYLLTIEMRVLGLFYWTNKTTLGWFEH